MSPDEHEPTSSEAVSHVLRDISSTMVLLYKDQFGRGPTSARSYWTGPDALTCLLEDTFTPAERNTEGQEGPSRIEDARP